MMTALLADTNLLNREFESTVSDIQPHYQQLNDEQLKTRISLWIRKFHEKSSDVNSAKTRNLYASLLLSMLRTNNVRDPFLDNPPTGSLLPLPDYHPGLTEITSKTTLNAGPSVPEWLDDVVCTGEEMHSVNGSLYSSIHLGSKFLQTPRTENCSVSSYSVALPLSKIGVTKRPSPRKSSPVSRTTPQVQQRTPGRNSIATLHQTCHATAKQPQNCWDDLESQPSTINISPAKVLSYVNGQQRNDRSRTADECETLQDADELGENEKMPIRDAMFLDQRAKLEAKHDLEIKRLLDKKNSEAEELRAYYRSKLAASESERDKLKERLSATIAELEEVKREKRSDVDAVRNVMLEAIDAKQADCERAIQRALEQAAAERNVLQKQQAIAIQQLLDETQSRLQRVEGEYRDQMNTATQMVQKLEESVRDLTVQNTNLTSQRNDLDQCCVRLQAQLNENEEQLDTIRNKFSELQDNHYAAMKRYEEQLNELQTKAAETEDLLRQELERTVDRHESEKRAAESAIDDLRQALCEVQADRQRAIAEVKQQSMCDVRAMRDQFEIKMAELAHEMELERAIAEKKITRLEIELGERDSELVAVVDKCRSEAAKNERQIEEFRTHVEQTTLKALSDSRAQFSELEKELARLKKEQTKAIQERDELKSAAEQIHKEHEQQIEDLVRAHAAELAIIRESAVHERDTSLNELRADFERKIRELNSRSHQLEIDMAANENEWKTRTARLVEQAASEARREQREVWEQQRIELVRAHDAEMAAAVEQWGMERKKMCTQLDDRMVAENAARELRESEMANLRNELSQLREVKSRESVETERRWSVELQRLQSELAAAQLERDTLQREFRLAKVQHEQKLREVTWNVEARLGEMLPANVRTDLEATIEALRNQVRHHEQANESLRARLALRMGGNGGSSIFSDNAPGTSGLGSEHGCDTICSHH